MTAKLTTLLLCLAVSALLVVATPQKPQNKDAKKVESVEPQTATVKISNFKFEPKTLTVKAGTTVTWTVDGGSHTVVSDGKTFTSTGLSAGKSFSHQFTTAGKYPYYCSLHGSAGGHDMAGEIIVTK